MKNQFANDVIQKMLPYIDNAQADKLRQTLFAVMECYDKALKNGYMFGCFGDSLLIID